MPYNDVEALEAVFAARGDRDRLRHHRGGRRQHGRRPARRPASPRRCAGSPAAHGALLVSDEVMTGFRVGRAGWWGHEGVDVAPDLMTFGKVMGGGFPAAAFGGRADVMALLAPDGPVYQAGTLSGNPVATAAGLATLRGLRRRALRPPRGGLAHRSPTRHPPPCSDAGVPHRVQWAGSMFSRLLPRRRGAHLRRRPRPGHRRVRPRSSTRCSTPASTCRRARSSRGSSPARTTTTAVERVLAALPGAAAAAAAGPTGSRA